MNPIRAALLVLAVAIAVVAIPSAVASPLERGGSTVKVGDDFFSPSKLNVKKGGSVTFKWLSSNKNKHNVTLTKSPSGVDGKNYTSKTEKRDYKFKPSFKKSGNYDFLCTIHPDTMRMKIDVKK